MRKVVAKIKAKAAVIKHRKKDTRMKDEQDKKESEREPEKKPEPQKPAPREDSHSESRTERPTRAASEKAETHVDSTREEILAKLEQTPILIIRKGEKPGDITITTPTPKDMTDIGKLLAGEEI